MKQFFLTLAGVFAGLLLFFVGLPILLIGLLVSAAKPSPPPARSILSLDLRQSLTDQDPNSPFAGFGGRTRSVITAVRTLREAGEDERVKGLLIRLPESGFTPAAADELRQAILQFRKSGKPVLAHSQGLYPGGVASAAYMLGAASGDYWMQPGASLQAAGVTAEDLFFKRAFDKYGVKADYEQRYEYKNAVNPYLYSDYTPAHRQSELGWMTSVYTSELAQAAADRKLDPAKLRAALEAGPYAAEDARARGLVDRVGLVQEAEAVMRAKAGAGAQFVDLFKYRRGDDRSGAPAPAVGGPAIALIRAEGPIVTGTGDNSGFGASQTVYSDDVAKAFTQAIRDKDVRAIVFRVSSPGGSDTASEQILEGVRAAKAAGKPVVVSMGTYAASGGYWISALASSIVAQPTTLTGSIGVFGGKFVTGPALAKFGVDTRSLTVGGEYAGAFGSGQSFTPTQRAAFSGWMDRIYAGFVARVAEGRHLPVGRVREIAKGRVWTGEQAKQLGLVDKLGGLYDAINEAKRLAKLPEGGRVRLKMLPGRSSPFEAVSRAFGMTSASVRTLSAAASVLGDPRAQAVIDGLARERAQATGGATVLAPTMVH